MELDSEEQASERAELHFLAAVLEELMNALRSKGLMTRDELQQIENAASERLGVTPRAW